MRKKKTLQELTIKDNFMFGAVMVQEDNARRLLELILGFSIDHVEITKEKCFIFHPEYKGIRLDLFAKDVDNTCYNVKMQVLFQDDLGKRSRYYHSQIDMELLSNGSEYSELSNAYVIFICDFDPFGYGRYLYTFQSLCKEWHDLALQDGRTSIFLSTEGANIEQVPSELVKFLKFVKADLNDSMKDFDDEFVGMLQESIANIKESRSMEERYMSLELVLQNERRAGRVEGKKEYILELLADLGTVLEELHERIMKERRMSVLDGWFKVAVKVESIEAFMESM